MALMLACSAVALTGHSVVHANAGVEQCMLCASHAGQPGIAHVAACPVPAEEGFRFATGLPAPALMPDGSKRTSNPRAPPLAS